jgi:hypothetical protein
VYVLGFYVLYLFTLLKFVSVQDLEARKQQTIDRLQIVGDYMSDFIDMVAEHEQFKKELKRTEKAAKAAAAAAAGGQSLGKTERSGTGIFLFSHCISFACFVFAPSWMIGEFF